MQTTEEITQLDPPAAWTVRGTGGPFVGIARGTIEPLDDGARSRVTIAVELEAHGIGKLLLRFVGRQARTAVARNVQALKEQLDDADRSLHRAGDARHVIPRKLAAMSG